MRNFIFIFLGVIEPDTDASIIELQARLKVALSENIQPVQFELKEELLMLTLSKPDFRFYLSFVKNNPEALRDSKQLAKDFELPWDIKPVNKNRLENIYAKLEQEGWSQYKPFHQTGFTILQEMENFRKVTVFTIPSMKSLL